MCSRPTWLTLRCAVCLYEGCTRCSPVPVHDSQRLTGGCATYNAPACASGTAPSWSRAPCILLTVNTNTHPSDDIFGRPSSGHMRLRYLLPLAHRAG